MKDRPEYVNNSKGSIKPVLEYLPDYTVYLNLPCILTLSKTLRIGMPYMYNEGLKTFPIRILHVWDSESFIYIRIQNMQTGQVYEISRNLNSDSAFNFWEIASFDYLITLGNDKVFINPE